ncbi:MAG: P1 family peptidase, partial [Methyloligellaceae bacterium]
MHWIQMNTTDQDKSPKPGVRNLITDVPGLKVANRAEAGLKSGVTVLLPDRPVKAAYDIRGGGVGSRELGALRPGGTVENIHGLVLSGGSAFGLDAATGVQAYLREKSVGFEIGDINVPIVPQAILFDLLNGGDKDWGTFPPYRDMAYAACADVSDTFELGSTGAGSGATTFGLKGGLGSASLKLEDGLIVGALAAVNAVGSVVIGQTRHFWAAPFEIDAEFGSHGLPEPFPKNPIPTLNLSEPGENTTLCVVATNAALDQNELTRLAIMAQTGMARAIMPVHTPLDGDIVFALST